MAFLGTVLFATGVSCFCLLGGVCWSWGLGVWFLGKFVSWFGKVFTLSAQFFVYARAYFFVCV